MVPSIPKTCSAPNFSLLLLFQRDSSVSVVAIRLQAGIPRKWGSSLGRARYEYFSCLHTVQTGCGTHSASYALGTVGSFPRCKVVRA
jgi:hypothetical protein